jgi:hypothetical protein
LSHLDFPTSRRADCLFISFALPTFLIYTYIKAQIKKEKGFMEEKKEKKEEEG